jgi:hypothetical protein
MTVDGVAANNRTDAVKVTYKNEPLTVTTESEAVRYLGFWSTPNGNMKSALDLVFERILKAKETMMTDWTGCGDKVTKQHGNSTKALQITHGHHQRIWGVWDIPQRWMS